ncbi:PQQ-binding-like beta-propeller repeat protein [Nannocystis radixulma]|uniref:PQQ-binding-like beta-propeller repeat protein n=1 Tax=Nannocystis radixulma TaxID=2995305 RepID=A0ABT5AYD2_9BACT|nr:PQQ-binding-like beta-propeller repeat protein [Nannocystis radixulma]MDC0666855.1 PQQ-binding-like beta-propeller repeat protein [Nannocystis radixulma]
MTETSSGGESSTGPVVDKCGDGALDRGEQCDDGNVLLGDGCLPGCILGDGTPLPPIDLPEEDGLFHCLTTIDAAVLGGASDVVVLGGKTWSSPAEALVQAFSLPVGQAVSGPFVHDAVFDRYVDQVATAEDGDIVVAGHTYFDAEQTSGHLWLARLSPAGELVWLREHEAILTHPEDLALMPAGDIVLASRIAGWGPAFRPSFIHRFDPDGELVWEHAGPAGPEWQAGYKGVAIDTDETIYAVGAGQHMGDPKWLLLVEAFTADGTQLWQTEAASPVNLRVAPSGIVVTDEGMLLVAGAESDSNGLFTDDPGLAAFDTTGAPLWWKTWSAPMFWNTSGGHIAALPGGGALVAWGHSQEDMNRTRVARYDAEGETLWELESDSATHPLDAVLGPDEALGPDTVFYVLEGRSVRPYRP